jgi:hypothetical protein
MPSSPGLLRDGRFEVAGNSVVNSQATTAISSLHTKGLDCAGSRGHNRALMRKASMRKPAALALGATIIVSSAIAGPPAPNELQCDFHTSVSSVARSGSSFFETEIRHEPGLHSITFSDINPLNRSAWAFGRDVDSGRAIVDVWEATWTFTEFTYQGNIFVTQVFVEEEPEAARDLFRAVRSRQWTAMGSVYATQQYGLCKAVY